MTEPVLRCPICWGVGRIRKPMPGGRATWAPCPACPPSETLNEALDRVPWSQPRDLTDWTPDPTAGSTTTTEATEPEPKEPKH